MPPIHSSLLPLNIVDMGCWRAWSPLQFSCSLA